MKKDLKEVEGYRVTVDRCELLGIDTFWASGPEDGNNGMFRIPKWGKTFRIIISDGEGWEHVSVTKEGLHTCPTWEEMCWVKSLFWEPDEACMQLHVADSDNISDHDYCLHIFRPIGVPIPLPDPMMV